MRYLFSLFLFLSVAFPNLGHTATLEHWRNHCLPLVQNEFQLTSNQDEVLSAGYCLGYADAIIKAGLHNCVMLRLFHENNEKSAAEAVRVGAFGAFDISISNQQMVAMMMKYSKENPEEWDKPLTIIGTQLVKYFDSLECELE